MQKQARAIRLEHIRIYEAGGRPSEEETWDGVAWTPARERDYRLNVALLYTMHNALLRRSEAAALRWRDLAPRTSAGRYGSPYPRARRAPNPLPGCSRNGRRATWRPSGQGVEAVRSRVPGNVGQAIQDKIVRAMGKIRPGCTGHSLRVGAAQDLTILGASLQQLKDAGGWRSLAMPANYAKGVRPEVGAVNLLELED